MIGSPMGSLTPMGYYSGWPTVIQTTTGLLTGLTMVIPKTTEKMKYSHLDSLTGWPKRMPTKKHLPMGQVHSAKT